MFERQKILFLLVLLGPIGAVANAVPPALPVRTFPALPYVVLVLGLAVAAPPAFWFRGLRRQQYIR